MTRLFSKIFTGVHVISVLGPSADAWRGSYACVCVYPWASICKREGRNNKRESSRKLCMSKVSILVVVTYFIHFTRLRCVLISRRNKKIICENIAPIIFIYIHMPHARLVYRSNDDASTWDKYTKTPKKRTLEKTTNSSAGNLPKSIDRVLTTMYLRISPQGYANLLSQLPKILLKSLS